MELKFTNSKIAKYLHIYCIVQSSPRSASGYFVHLKIESWRNCSLISLFVWIFVKLFFTELKSYEAEEYVPRSRVRDQ